MRKDTVKREHKKILSAKNEGRNTDRAVYTDQSDQKNKQKQSDSSDCYDLLYIW